MTIRVKTVGCATTSSVSTSSPRVLTELKLIKYTEGEFHVDLYTLPDNLVKMLWDFTTEKTGISASA